MILDKLMEKKDLSAYCTFRIKLLRADYKKNLPHIPEDKKQLFKANMSSRIAELTYLKGHINQVKDLSIYMSESMLDKMTCKNCGHELVKDKGRIRHATELSGKCVEGECGCNCDKPEPKVSK